MKNAVIALLLFLLTLSPAAAIGAEEARLPDSVKVKTPTQTFNRYYYFALKEGRIFFKSNTETTGRSEDWMPFQGTGLPGNGGIAKYPVPSSIKAIHADADEVVAVSDAGRVYWLRIEKGMSWTGKVWNHLWGWPEAEPLFLAGRAANGRAWAIGRRNKDVLYHEDVDGNPHHFGTMGITTLYVLTRDGREICFTDSGLPADFSHTIALPHRGAFIAEAMSVSASTIFVIDALGRMYTRLIDFDTVGSDPMFFKYSYRREKRNEKGEEWGSNFTEWSLPAEDWREQPQIVLEGQAALSSIITILQNGKGNAARELRVAGRNGEGKTGYFHKMIFDDRWEFMEWPVPLDEARMLSGSGHAEGQLLSGDSRYSGKIRKAGTYLPATSVELVDFNLFESPATLRVRENGKVSEMKLHSVEAWTYLKRKDPGRDGTPKLFLGTLEMATGGEDRGETIKALEEHNLKTFRFVIEATEEYVYIRPRSGYGDIEFILTVGETPVRSSMAVRAAALNNFDRIANSEDLKVDSYESLTMVDIPLLRQKVEANRQAIAQMDSILEGMESSSKRIGTTSLLYGVFNTVAHATGLFLLDKPKIWTATRHLGALLDGNKESSDFLYSMGKLAHDEAVTKVRNRVNAYSDKIDELEGRERRRVFFSEHFSDYLQRLGISDTRVESVLPGDIQGVCDITPVIAGKPYLFIRLKNKEDIDLMTLLVRLPKLDEEINRQTTGDAIALGEHEARIYLFETNGSSEAEALYRSIFTGRYPIRNKADVVEALLRTDKDGWQLYDTSGFEKDQIWVKYRKDSPPDSPVYTRLENRAVANSQ